MLALADATRANLEAFLVLGATGLALVVFLLSAIAWSRTRLPKVGLVSLAFLVLLLKNAWFSVRFLADYPAHDTLITASAAADLALLVLLYLGIVRAG